MALPKGLTILLGDISVAFMNTPMPEGDPVYVEPPEGPYEHNDTVWCLKRAERFEGRFSTLHFAAVLTTWFPLDQEHSQLFSWIFRATCSLQCTSMI